ncbi:MAG: 5-oxoprolinase subunit PxpB [Campylobacterota bacterium]
MHIKVASVDSIIVYFSDTISKASAKKVKEAYTCINSLDDKAIIEIIPSYTSIFITYDIFKYSFDDMKTLIQDCVNTKIQENIQDKIVEVDVYYGVDVGFDLNNISKKTDLSVSDIIQLHSQKTYDVYAIGFLPGFAYLGSVHSKIAMPRLSTPRKLIPKGCVAIANTQTAVYPKQSPGGWNIIGRTAFEFFDKSLETLSCLKVGDKVKFNPITKKEFLKQGGKI